MPETQAKVEVDVKEARVATLPRSLSDDYRKKLGALIELTDEQRTRLKKWLKHHITEWKQDTAELHDRLQQDNELVEGIVDETDYPFEGASNVHVPVTEMYMEVYKSIFKRSILGADLIWYGETDVDELKEALADIEESLNYKARHEWNIEECLSNVFWTTSRDGLGAIQVTWSEEYEPARDVVLLESEQDFMTEFASPEEAGLSEEEYIQLWQYVSQNASPELPVEVPITFEKMKYYGNKGEVVELIDFVTIPATVPHIKDQSCRGYGKRFSYRKGTIKKKMDEGIYYEEAAKKVIAKQGRGGTTITSYTNSKDEIEGLKRTGKDDFELFELAIKGQLDGESDEMGEREFLVTYSLEFDELLQCIEYPYRIPFYAIFRINKRPNRLVGRSVPIKVRDLNDEIDTQHNQRINTRSISSIPSFKAQNNAKKLLDPMLQNNKWKPGVIFWLDDFNTFEQMIVQPTDQGESMSEEQNDFKILDLYLGSAVALLSGGAAPGDPNAPGNKTAIMIQQSNLRMDDPLGELREGVAELGDICLSHLYQFGPPIIEYQSEVETAQGKRRETKTLHKKWLRRGIHLQMKGVTVTQNPDAEMQKKFQLYQVLMTEPTFQQNADARVTLLRDALRAGREQGREKYLPTPEELQQQQIEMQKQAMMQMQQEQAMQAQAAKEQELKQRLTDAATHLKIKSTAKKLAENNLDLGGAPVANGTFSNGAHPQPNFNSDEVGA